jgi:hypothetical protein
VKVRGPCRQGAGDRSPLRGRAADDGLLAPTPSGRTHRLGRSGESFLQARRGTPLRVYRHPTPTPIATPGSARSKMRAAPESRLR